MTHNCTAPKKALTIVPLKSIDWKRCKNGVIPPEAVVGGTTEFGQPLYIGRTRLRENNNEFTPGLIAKPDETLLVSYGTGVRTTKEFDVLVAIDPHITHWVPCSKGHIPDNSVIGGIDCSYLEPLYIGRTRGTLLNGRTWRGQKLKDPVLGSCGDTEVQIPGKVHRTHRCLYIPYKGKEYLFRDYEVLALKESPASLSMLCKNVINSRLEEVCALLDDFQIEGMASDSIDRLPLPDKLKEYCKQRGVDDCDY
uniref:Uncharacterized LOC100184299 n=1 Tax=Ciona intestinalis TaxID=7719 RepID=F6ZPA1_CIOIN|nr:uncharacterized protein LOC100184299 [Ciona intestinalis]|eukprot:XP_002131710.1 uncharacterized protein LOC100184299 [Ciona intestinalis]